MVQTGTIDKQRFAVENKTFLSRILNSTDAISDGQYITLCLDGRMIKVWIVRRPEVGIIYVDGLLDGFAFPILHHHLSLDVHRMNVGRRHLDAPFIDIALPFCLQPHVTVDARSRKPTAVRLFTIVHLDQHLIFALVLI